MSMTSLILTGRLLLQCRHKTALCPWEGMHIFTLLSTINDNIDINIPYPHKRGPMGGAPYTGPRLGGGPVLVSHLDVKECPGKLPIQAL